MGLADKFEIKRGTLTSVGVKVEELLEGAERNAHEACGGKKALLAHMQNLLGIVAAVDDEVEKSIPDLETAKLVKGWLSKTVVATENAARHMEAMELRAMGEVSGHTALHDVIQKMASTVETRQRQVEELAKSGEVESEGGEVSMKGGNGSRPTGVRPAPPIKAQRLAEEAKKSPPRKTAKKKTTRRKKVATK